jgi:hypothetical protein
MKMSLVFAIPKPEEARSLEQGFGSRAEFAVRQVRLIDLASDIDAVYVSITAAERWGAANRPIIHQAQVFRTTADDRAAGWPPFVIAGLIARQDEDVFDPRLMPLIIRAAIVAARRLNAQGSELIETIGFESGWTLIDKWPPVEAARTICAAYDEAMAVADDKLDTYGRVKPHIVATIDFITTTGQRSRAEWRCLLEFQGEHYGCALILDEIDRLGLGGTEGVPIEFLPPEAIRPPLQAGSRFTLWEKRRIGRRRIADGVVERILPD